MLGTYDSWRASAPEDDREPPPPCCVCTGEDAPPCSEECERLVKAIERRNRIHRLYGAIDRAMWWARTYYLPNWPPDPRVIACMEQVRAYRREIRDLRAAA